MGTMMDITATMNGMSYDGDYDGWDRHGGDHGDLDGHGGGKYIDWLNPGGYYYTSWYYPTYTNYWYYPTYTYYWYPEYTYTYPAYYNPAPVVNPAVTVYTTYYPDPLVYDHGMPPTSMVGAG